MSRFLERSAHLCASGFSASFAASAAHGSFTTYRSVFAARFVFASFILIASLIGPQPTYAVDYVVTGLNTATNGNGNPDPITGVGDTLILSEGSSISTTFNSAEGIHFASAGQNTIVNMGTISTTGIASNGIYNFRSNVVTIDNHGSISTSGDAASGITSHNSDNVIINNSGSVQVGNIRAVGIRSNRSVIVINSGLVFASPTSIAAIELSTGNDNLTLSAGSRIQGLIDLNDGDDTVTLNHGGNDIAWRWTFENFKDTSPDVLSVIGAPYVVEDPGLSGGAGITVTVADLSRESNAGAVLADLTGAVRGAVTGRIAEAWALSDAGLSTGAEMTDEDGNALGWNAWAKAFGGRSADARHTYGGVVVGADTAPTDSTLFGVFGGFALSKLTFADPSLNNSGIADVDTNSGFGGIYGRIQNAHGLFADGTVTLGYAESDVEARWQANNLVAGGLEQIAGGESAGAYIATSATFGAHMPVGGGSVVVIPSATIGYAAQFRKGYSEDASVEGAMNVESYVAAVLTTRLQLAAQMSGSNANGLGWTAALRGGIDVEKDVSQDVELTMVGTSLSADVAPDDADLTGFLGTNLALALSERIALTLDGEMTFAGNNADDIGGTMNAGIRARF